MKRLLTFLTLLTVFIGVGWANDATFSPSDFSGQGTTSSGSPISATVDGVTFACDKGYGTTQIRCYSGGTITISSDNTITGISFTFSGSYTGGLETSYTGLSTKSWERTLSSQARITSVTVTYTSGQVTPTAAAPTFSPVEGTYVGTQTVTISSDTEDATIYYTTNGNDPTTSSQSISNDGTVTISSSCTLKAMAVASGHNNSSISSATYTIVTDNTPSEAITATFDATVDAGSSPLSKGPITFTCSNGNLSDGVAYRLYSGSTNTFSVPEGYKIVKIEFTGNSTSYPVSRLTSNVGNYTVSNNIGTWIGNAESVSFAADGQARASSITVYYTAPDVNSNIYRVIKTNGNASDESGGWFGYWSENCEMPNGTDGNHYTVTAPAGETVQFKAGTNSGFQILDSNVSAVDGDNNTITLTKVANLSDNTGSTFTFTMPATDVTLTANFTSYQSDLYILGTANDKTWSPSDGVKMTYDATAQKYSADVYFAGTSGDGAYGFFSFAESLTGDWNTLVRYGATTNNKDISNGTETLQGGSNSFKIPAGIYTIEVNKAKNQVTVTPKQVEFTFSPAAGSSVNQGQTVTVSSNLYTLLSAINSSIAESSVTNEVSLDGTTYSSSVPLSSTGSVTVTGKATYGYYAPTSTANYTVNEVAEGDEFELVTDATTLNEGDEVIITTSATPGSAKAMGADRGNNRGVDDVTITSDLKVAVNPSSDVQILTLESGESCWYFKAGDNLYLRADGGSSSNYLKTGAKHDNAKASITSGSNDVAEIVFQITGNRKYLRYNSSNNPPIMSCYESGKQSAVYLFRRAANTNQSAMPVINPGTSNIKGGLVNVTITAAEGAAIYYTTDGSEPTTSTPYNGAFDITGTGGQIKTVKAIAVETGKDASKVASATYTFQAPSNPVITPDGGTYDGRQHVTISSTDGGIIYYLVDPETTPTNAADVINAGQVYTPGTTAITLEAGIHKVYAAVNLNGITSWAQESYTINADPMTLSFSPAAGTYVNAQSVTITANNAIGDYTIYYTTDGTEATASSTVYSGPITVAQDMTINAYAVDSRDQGLNGKEATASATYNIGVQPVEYSPLPGNYYKGSEDGDITVEMFSITPNAKIYYTMTDDGTEPADPSTSSTLFTGDIPLEVGKTYNFKAIAVAGQQVTPIAPATYTVSELQTGESGWVNINAMNIDDNYSTDEYLLNPVQVVYMSTWRNRGDKPEFCFIRDNSGYGMIYFGNSDVTAYNSWAKFQMGDWLPGNSISGKLNVWSDSFINELGGSSGTLSTWPSANDKLGNSDILPEETTNLAITQGWTYDGAFTPSANDGYENHIDAEKNLFGHYVHMRKNTIDNVTGAGGGAGKHTGIITDQSGVPLNYYDGLYLFSGYNNTPDYNQEFFDNIQNNGGTFDIYAIVYFYGPNAKKEEYSYAPYEIFPIDFLYIYKPKFNIESGTYMEPQTVTLTCATEGAQIWYKTSEMEDYALYTGPITVDATTTIDAYSTIPTKYNDVMESAINSITINIGSIEAPVITEPSVVKTVGESVTTSITCSTYGATIYYTTDGSDPKTSETRKVYSSDLTFEETTTVRAIAYKEVEGTGYYSAEAEAKTYTFVKSNGIIYDLVTSTSQLNENSVYVIVNKANNMAVGTTQNENNRAADGVKFVDEATKTQVFGNDDLAQFTLKKVGNNWYLQTANSTENGYLYVGNGNTLMTEATADGNAEATINIDGNSDAHISFMYNYETVRYLRYWLGGKAFSTYTSEASNLPVSLYYIQATPLATIEREGVTTEGKNQYTIADQLIAVYADDVKGILWCKDQGNVSIDKTYIHDGQVDFLYNDSQAQNGRDWDQSNWIALQFSDPTATNNIGLLLKNAEGKYIKPATVQGYYIDDVNFTLQMAEDKLELVTQADAGYDEQIYTPNVYCASNFLPDNLNIHGSIENGDGGYTGDPQINTQNYFFMNPKIQEVCEITYAQWDASHECFTVPSASGFDGAFNVGWGYNVLGNLKSSLQDEHVYRFKAVVQRSNKESYGPKNVTESFAHITVYPVDLDTREGGSEIVTAINTVDVNGKAVKSVKYVNVAGIVSDVPFQGVNIVVTEYTDGSRTTTKMLKK